MFTFICQVVTLLSLVDIAVSLWRTERNLRMVQANLREIQLNMEIVRDNLRRGGRA